jgi:hypothetical protein
MTPTEMEEAIRNLQLQWHRIEEFLPNLATRGELYALRDDLVVVRDAWRLEIQDALQQTISAQQQTLSAQIGQLASQIATLTRHRKN